MYMGFFKSAPAYPARPRRPVSPVKTQGTAVWFLILAARRLLLIRLLKPHHRGLARLLHLVGWLLLMGLLLQRTSDATHHIVHLSTADQRLTLSKVNWAAIG